MADVAEQVQQAVEGLAEEVVKDQATTRKLPIPMWAVIVILIIGLWIFCAVVHVVIAESRNKHRMNMDLDRMRNEAKKIRKLNLSKKDERAAWKHLHSQSNSLFPCAEDVAESNNNVDNQAAGKKEDKEYDDDPVWASAGFETPSKPTPKNNKKKSSLRKRN